MKQQGRCAAHADQLPALVFLFDLPLWATTTVYTVLQLQKNSNTKIQFCTIQA